MSFFDRLFMNMIAGAVPFAFINSGQWSLYQGIMFMLGLNILWQLEFLNKSISKEGHGN